MNFRTPAVSAAVLIAALATSNALAQTPATAKTEAQAQAATGKATTDRPANTKVQGQARAVSEAAPAAAGANTAAQTPAPAAAASVQVTPNGDLIETLKAAGQFNMFIKAADTTNLTGLLKTNKNLTVFAPTDAAFAAMAPAERDQLMADKTALQKFVLRHVINAPVDSSKIKGARGPVPSGAGDQILLDGSDEAGAMKADGATIVQSDIRTGSGLLHVVDRVLVAGQGGQAAAETGEATGSSATAPADQSGTKPKAEQ